MLAGSYKGVWGSLRPLPLPLGERKTHGNDIERPLGPTLPVTAPESLSTHGEGTLRCRGYSHRPGPPGARGKGGGIKRSLALPSKSCFVQVSAFIYSLDPH